MSAADRETLLARLAAVLESRPEVLEAYLHGSTERGESLPTWTRFSSSTEGILFSEDE